MMNIETYYQIVGFRPKFKNLKDAKQWALKENRTYPKSHPSKLKISSPTIIKFEIKSEIVFS